MRRETDFRCAIKLIWPVQSPRRKYSTFVFPEIMVLSPIPSRAEGRIAVVTTCEAGSGGRGGLQRGLLAPTNNPPRTVKSLGPDIPMLISTHVEALLRVGMMARKPGAPGRKRSSRSTIAQGGPDFRLTCGTCRLHFFRRRATGLSRGPAFPAPSRFPGGLTMYHPDGPSAAGSRDHARLSPQERRPVVPTSKANRRSLERSRQHRGLPREPSDIVPAPRSDREYCGTVATLPRMRYELDMISRSWSRSKCQYRKPMHRARRATSVDTDAVTAPASPAPRFALIRIP